MKSRRACLLTGLLLLFQCWCSQSICLVITMIRNISHYHGRQLQLGIPLQKEKKTVTNQNCYNDKKWTGMDISQQYQGWPHYKQIQIFLFPVWIYNLNNKMQSKHNNTNRLFFSYDLSFLFSQNHYTVVKLFNDSTRIK